MKKKEPIFLIFAIIVVGLFLFGGYSLIKVLYNDDWENETATSLLHAIYLVLHFAFTGILFYLNFRAYMLGPQLIHGLTLDDDNKMKTKSVVSAGILGIFFLFFAIYSLLIILKVDVPLTAIFKYGLSYAILNGSLILFFIALEIFIYPFIYKEKNK